MKIRRISLGKKVYEPISGRVEQDCSLYLFNTPVIFSFDGVERACGSSTVMIYDGGVPQYIRGTSGRGVKLDVVTFRLSSADRQYISSMNVPFNTPIEVSDDFVIASALKSLNMQWDIAANRRAELAELYMRIIFITLEQHINGAGEREVPHYRRLKQVRDAIYSDPVREWTVAEVCTYLGISRTYFHRLYSEAFGVTFGQDVIESRLAYAAELLKTTKLSVSAIAEQCGYESDAYFMKQFREHRGCTPTEYRRLAEL